MYYRLIDNECGGYMATGYNAESEKELANAYKELMIEGSDNATSIKRLSIKDTLKLIESNGLEIEKSETKFDTDEW